MRFGNQVTLVAVGLIVLAIVTSSGGVQGVVVQGRPSYYGSVSASPNPVSATASVTVYCSYSAYYLKSDPASPGFCIVDGYYWTVYRGTGATGSGSQTFPPGTFSVGTHMMMAYYATGYNRQGKSYYWSVTTAILTVTGDPPVSYSITGSVVLGDPVTYGATTTGLYGAEVSAISSGGTKVTSYTDSTGAYSIPVAGTGDYTVQASATGFCANAERLPPNSQVCSRNQGLVASTSARVVASGPTPAPPIPMFMHPTYTPAVNQVWWELADNCANGGLTCKPYKDAAGTPITLTLDRSLNVAGYQGGSSPSASIVSASGESLTGYQYAPPSGASNVIKIVGKDTSAAGTGTSYAYFGLSGVNVALTAPSMLTFYVIDVHTPAGNKGPVLSSSSACNQRSSMDPWTTLGNGMVSVEAIFSDGTRMSSVQDSRGEYIKNGFGVRVAPGFDQYRVDAHFPENSWYRVTVDLSELRYKTITTLQFAYDNCGNGGSVLGAADSYFKVYFDDVRIEMARPPANIPNSGFEPDLSGWGVSGGVKPYVTNHPYRGVNSAVVGWDYSARGPPANLAEDSFLYQAFRVPYDAYYYSPRLSFAIQPHTTDPCLCTTNNWVKVYLMDRTTLQTLPPIHFGNSNTEGIGWLTYQFDMSHYAGHTFWLVIQAHTNVIGYATWAYVDEVQLVPQGVDLSHLGYFQGTSAPYYANINLDKNLYLPSGTSHGILPISIAGYAPAPFSGGGMVLGLDLYRYNHLDPPGTDNLVFAVSALVKVPGFTAEPLNNAVIHGYVVMGAKVQVHVEGPGVSVAFEKGYADSLTADTGNNNVDPADLLLTAADGIFTAAGLIPGAPVILAWVSGGLYVASIAYGMYKFLTAPPPDPTTAYREAWGGCPMCAPYQIGFHAGQTLSTRGFLGDGTGGLFFVRTTVTAIVAPVTCVVNMQDQWQCTNANPSNPYTWSSEMVLQLMA